MTAELRYCHIDSPVGPLLLAGDEQALWMLSFTSGPKARQPKADWRLDDGFFKDVAAQLLAYFATELRTFELALKDEGTVFQQRVWQALRAIPYGETLSYGELATRLEKPTAARAVGAANAANPIAIITPCHRVIGADRKLTGFGGGLDTKSFLLLLEKPDLLHGL